MFFHLDIISYNYRNSLECMIFIFYYTHSLAHHVNTEVVTIGLRICQKAIQIIIQARR